MTENRKQNCLFAVMGQSPAVLTEFAWGLVTQRGLNIDRVEIWTTSTSDAASVPNCYDKLVDGGWWQQLSSALGHLPLPPLSAANFHTFCHEGRHLTDIRTPADHEIMTAQLCNRLKELRAEDPSLEIHASLAGGRKSMSAALQTAMQLFGQEGDRLYHVLLHPDIEASPQRLTFRFPGDPIPLGPGSIPLHEQVDLVEQPFIRLNKLIPLVSQVTVNGHALNIEPTIGTFGMSLMDMVNSTARMQVGGGQRARASLEALGELLDGQPQQIRFRKSTGDGFLAIYATVQDDLCAARGVLAALEQRGEGSDYRFVLHHGEAVLSPMMDVLGPEVHRLFRIEGAAKGLGQMVISAAAKARLQRADRKYFNVRSKLALRGFKGATTVWAEATQLGDGASILAPAAPA